MNDTKIDAPFEHGDVVILNSGGPAMTVLANHGRYSEVAWFTSSEFSDDDLCTRGFPNACLEMIDDFDGTEDDGERTAAAGEVIDINFRPANGDVQQAVREASVA